MWKISRPPQKETGPSSLETYLPKVSFSSQAERVVLGQRLMQAASDIFLGWNKGPANDYYWRQLKDQNGSFDMQKLNKRGMATYLGVCAACLARAHARTGDAAAMSGYMGKGHVFDKAIEKFAQAYADQTESDFQALQDAVKNGRITARAGI